MSKPWRENDELFKELLARGQGVERYVAARLREDGFDAWCPEQSVREDISQAGEYFNQTDVCVAVRPAAPSWHALRIEVKERPNVAFTSPDDIPEYLMPFFICECKDYDGKPDNVKPHVMIAVSGKTGAMVAIRTHPGLTECWARVPVFDTVRNLWTLNYAAPREHWRSYDALTVWLAAKVQLARGAVTGARPDHTNWADYQRCLELLRVKDVEGGVSVNGRRGTLINAQVTVPRMPPGCRVVFLDEKEIVRDSNTRNNPRGTPVSRDYPSEQIEVVTRRSRKGEA